MQRNLIWTSRFAIIVILFIAVLLSSTNPMGFMERKAAILPNSSSLFYDFYRDSCPQGEQIVRSTMTSLYSQNSSIAAQLLRLFFHDCFVMGCDASIFLDDSNGNKSHPVEKHAIPNRTLRGFAEIDAIKEELERECPGVVSCADTLALATREGILLAGGPFYPVLTGRKDSTISYFEEALTEIPRPDDNITHMLHLFSARGFSERETVSVLGGHSIGKISCEFVQNRLSNFRGTGLPDLSLASDLRSEIIDKCKTSNSSFENGSPTRNFDSHYYRNLLRGRGLLFADQQLMADQRTADFVRAYATDVGHTFRTDFARAMVKMSSLGILETLQGEVRTSCSIPLGFSESKS